MWRFYQYNWNVTPQFDLNLLPLHRIKGQEWPQLPGLVAVMPPKRPARGREGDSLVLYLTISGNAPFSSAEYAQVTSQVAQRFFQTAGSLTSAVRTAAEAINQFVLDRNLRTTGQGQYVVGRLIVGVLRGEQFMVAQCGPTHIFHLTAGEAHQIHDEQISGRGIGISQATSLYFAQVDLRPGDLLVLCADLPIGWDAALLGERGRSPETIRRKMVSVTPDDLNAVLVQIQPGSGTLTILRGAESANEPPVLAAPPPSPPPAHVQQAEPPTVRASSEVQNEQPASRFARLLAGADKPAGQVPAASALPIETPGASTISPVENAPTSAPIPTPARRPAPTTSATSAARTATTRTRGRFVAPRTQGDMPVIKRPASPQQQEFFRGLVRIIRSVRAGADKVTHTIKVFLPTLLPNLRDGEAQMTSSNMLFLAVAIPILIVVIAGTVYTSRGKVTQYQEYYALAVDQASLARGQTNPTEVRRAWDSTIFYLDKAKTYQQTQDEANLRQEAQTALDNLDSILRLDFRPAIVGGLSSTMNITRLAATNTDLYLLDASRGDVSRFVLDGTVYTKDTEFECGPGQYGETIVGSLLDIEALQMSNIYNARVMAIDANGTLLYCGLTGPVAMPLVPPQFGWHGISSFSLDADGKTLYVLDPAGNAIWQYAGNYGEFAELPVMFFGEQVPQGMNTAIDLAANNADMYVLFADGHMAACPLVRYDVVPVRCTDPITFVDTRPERQPGTRINDAIFTQTSFAAAPDPSLYLLEPLTRAVYRFSPRSDSLELRGQFRATMEQNNELFVGPAGAMTIGPNRFIFFSIGNQVYFASDVP